MTSGGLNALDMTCFDGAVVLSKLRPEILLTYGLWIEKVNVFNEANGNGQCGWGK